MPGSMRASRRSALRNAGGISNHPFGDLRGRGGRSRRGGRGRCRGAFGGGHAFGPVAGLFGTQAFAVAQHARRQFRRFVRQSFLAPLELGIHRLQGQCVELIRRRGYVDALVACRALAMLATCIVRCANQLSAMIAMQLDRH